VFAAIFGRLPDDSDGDAGEQLSHCYAALPAAESQGRMRT
jgi:hypothetical protein